MKKLIVLFIFCIQIGCINQKSKERLIGVSKVELGLYREKYRVFSGGAYSAELYSDYLTDSVNFKMYVGTHDESQNFQYKCVAATVKIEKIQFSDDGRVKIIQSKSYDLPKLKRQHSFE